VRVLTRRLLLMIMGDEVQGRKSHVACRGAEPYGTYRVVSATGTFLVT
jgi:hypothetical protein